MGKTTAILALGVLVALIPFLGIPFSWKQAFLVPAGVAIAALGYLLRRAERRGAGQGRHGTHDTYTESEAASRDAPHDTDDAYEDSSATPAEDERS